MPKIFIITILIFLGINSFGQQMTGVGVEFSPIALKPNVRMWLSRTSGFEVFGGVSAEFSDFKPNDFEGGLKYLHTFLYDRTERTYFGLVGKYKWVNLEWAYTKIDLPVFGALIGREWLKKRTHLRGFAIELGYQFGQKKYLRKDHINQSVIAEDTFDEFQLILNLRYSLYKKN